MKKDNEDKNAKEFFYDNDVEKFDYEFLKDDKNVLESAIEAKSNLEAKKILQHLVFKFQTRNKGVSDEDATLIIKSRIGYYAGYFDDSVRERVEQLYDTEHPMFGKFVEMGAPSSAEAYQCGYGQTHLSVLRIEKLNEELKKLREHNSSIWSDYGSELCVGDMVNRENEILRQIEKLRR